MKIRLAVEDMEPNHWIACALDLQGCYSSAGSATDAISHAPQKIAEYFSWITNHGRLHPMAHEPIKVVVVETFHSFASRKDPEYLVNAFFEDDRVPLEIQEIEIALKMLEFTRKDLIGVIQSTNINQRTKPITGEIRGSINGILRHAAIAENWYFGQLGLGLEQGDLPEDPLENLEVVRANSREQLVKLVGEEKVTKDCDELWSGRKIVRRTLWHERDHTQQIIRLISDLKI